MEPLIDLLPKVIRVEKIHPSTRKRIEGVELVRVARDEDQQELAYHSRPFVLCGLPIRRPPPAVREYTRRNGNFYLRIATDSLLGLPYGQDRLIPLWVATLAIRQQSRLVTFDSAAQLLREFGLTQGGTHYRRLVQGFERIFEATIYFGVEGMVGQARVVDRARFNFFDRMRLWYFDDEQLSLPDDEFKNLIVLSEQFWDEVKRHPIPVDLGIVRALAHSPGALDFAVWISWRCWTAKQEEPIPLFGETGLVMQLGVQDYSRDRKFRERITAWLKIVRTLWPKCPAYLSDNGQYLIVRPGHAIRAVPGR